ncbi:ABC transporter permease [Phytoactinopolyspora halotolerans]|uniref:ABC transporter permease n=1 Tax=Phytoactinopolyspora halotolerans TaxID=1981512 RepID=A0A6L9SF25_9ACTN|nr:ABC transporter permease [Phytoactinopolyspora halotolerans]NEE03264.1 ABC transporter permease [Phytoactinopolyspora halotolerans]
MLLYTLRRTAQMLVVVLCVVTLVFLLLRIAAGDPARLMNAPDAPDEVVEATRERLGLDEPIYVQYLYFLRDLFSGDLGQSFQGGYSVAQVVFAALPNTAMLAAVTVVVSTLIALALGIGAALTRGSWFDRAVQVYVAFAQSIPSFWLAVVLVLVFAVQLGWLPAVDFTGPASFVLPVTTMAVALTPILIRTIRQSFIETLEQDYIRAARARGIAQRKILLVHTLKVASLPLVTLIGLQSGMILAGSYVVENIFNWPGIGKLAVDALTSRNFPMVQGAVLIAAVTFVLVNFVVDMLYTTLDPRIRLKGAS